MDKPNVPFYVKRLPQILLFICVLHVTVKSLLLKNQWGYVQDNTTNTHFGLTCVLIFLLALLISLIFLDLFVKNHFTFRYVIGFNIAVVASGLFIAGYLLGFILEISYAQMFSRSNLHGSDACHQLGLGIPPNITVNSENMTISSSDAIDKQEKAFCDMMVSIVFHQITFDLLVIFISLPLHISATAFSWTFSGLYRIRSTDEDDL